MINIQEIVLDVAHENSFKILHAKQYDENSRFLKIVEKIHIPFIQVYQTLLKHLMLSMKIKTLKKIKL